MTYELDINAIRARFDEAWVGDFDAAKAWWSAKDIPVLLDALTAADVVGPAPTTPDEGREGWCHDCNQWIEPHDPNCPRVIATHVALAAAEAERDATNALINSARISLDQVTAERDALARAALAVMDTLEEYGPSIVPHLIDTDENDGERLRVLARRALSVEAAGTEGGGGHE
jgi:hypothetical protein